MAAPVQFCVNQGNLTTTATATVSAATAAGDALLLGMSFAGSTPPVPSSVTDTKGNTWSQLSVSSSNAPIIYVYIAHTANNAGGTKALTTSDVITVAWGGSPSGGWALLGADCAGYDATDVTATPTNATSTTPSVSLTPATASSLAVAIFGWANGGGAGSVNSPFASVGQEHMSSASSGYLTLSYDVAPPTGTSLSSTCTITSAAWRALMVTLKPAVSAFIAKPNHGPNQAVMRSAVW